MADERRGLATGIDDRRHRDSRMNARYIHSPPGYSRTPDRRARSYERPFTEGGGRPLRRSRSVGRNGERTGVKRNRRLADRPRPKTPPKVEKKPKTPKSAVPPPPAAGEVGCVLPRRLFKCMKTNAFSVCPQCFDRNYSYTNEEVLKKHWNTGCPCLTRCEYCDQTVHVADLNAHHLTECEFVKGTQEPCPLCGLSQYQGETNHPRCPRERPPMGAAWCPLCSRADAWRKHLIDECYNNPRNAQRWAGRNAPTNGSSLLGGLDGVQPVSIPIQQPSARPTGQMPANFAPTAGSRPNQPAAPQNSPTVPQNVAGQRQGGPNPAQLRQAYQKLQEERRNNYEKQRQLDEAAEAEKEEEDV
ncbi:Protein C40H1.3 [Aphelenchoides fujianensis]|nr:Protein C40H1.3 [Aphelenchoides fujianensis]